MNDSQSDCCSQHEHFYTIWPVFFSTSTSSVCTSANIAVRNKNHAACVWGGCICCRCLQCSISQSSTPINSSSVAWHSCELQFHNESHNVFQRQQKYIFIKWIMHCNTHCHRTLFNNRSWDGFKKQEEKFMEEGTIKIKLLTQEAAELQIAGIWEDTQAWCYFYLFLSICSWALQRQGFGWDWPLLLPQVPFLTSLSGQWDFFGRVVASLNILCDNWSAIWFSHDLGKLLPQ